MESRILDFTNPAKDQNKKHNKKTKALADAEMKTNISETEVFVLPSGQEIEKETLETADLTVINQRIKDNLHALSNFKKYRQNGRSRSKYLALLTRDLMIYYSYNEYFMEYLVNLFPGGEILEFLEACEVKTRFSTGAHKSWCQSRSNWEMVKGWIGCI